MNLQNAVVTAVRALSKNKMRAALTSVGIIIGVSSVIVMIGLGNSARVSILGRIKTYGYNAISVESDDCRFQSSDLETIKKSFGNIQYTTPVSSRREIVRRERYALESKVCGSDNDYFRIKQREIVAGRGFNDVEIFRGDKVAVVGQTISRELFNGKSPVENKIIIGDLPYTIIGELDSMGESFSNYDNDNEIIIPYTTANQKLYQRSYFTDFYVSVINEKLLDSSVRDIRQYIRKKFHMSNMQEDNFKIYTSREKIGMLGDVSEALSILLAGIASISLIVGGIGIMNIMLVSVTERTREIGIRMAIGAKKSDILMQFLIESVTLSSGGGIAGIVLGLILYYVIIIFAKWPFIFSFSSVLLSFSFAALVGIFFGFWPAQKASALRPIDALKFE